MALRFGGFEYRPHDRVLVKVGQAVRLGSRALRILETLLRTPGEYVGREALIAAAWPDSVVEESNLRVQINALRRVLGGGQIGSVPGHGYALRGPVEIVALPPRPASGPPCAGPGSSSAGRIPTRLTRIIGRAHDIEAIAERLAEGRLVTVVGPGGIGKTRVAVAAAERLVDDGRGRGVFVDLSSLPHGASVVGAIASALRIEDDPGRPIDGRVEAALAAERTLLVLDNCEHVVEACARVAETLSRAVATLRVLATSREPLRCEGEQVLRLEGLGMPGDDVALSARHAIGFPAVELLLERARAAHGAFAFDDGDALLAVALCRRLDGLPLAIELAAAQLSVLGIEELIRAIDRQIGALAHGQRTAPPRHQTLSATLDWSYATLDADEARVFAALSVFRAGFSTTSANAVLASLAVDVPRSLLDLVGRSLVIAEPRGEGAKLRLLHVTRAYARSKLDGSPDAAPVGLAHATYVQGELVRLTADQTLTAHERRDAYGALIDDIRGAIDWSFGEGGDVCTGVRVIAASAPAWVKLSLTHDYMAFIETAVARVSTSETVAARDLMGLYAQLLTTTTIFTTAGPVARMKRLLENAIAAARGTAGVDAQIVALWGLFGVGLIEAEYGEAMAYAREIATLSVTMGDGRSHAMGHRVVALGEFRTGRVRDALTSVEKASLPVVGESVIERRSLVYKHVVAVATAHAGIAWLAGRPKQAAAKAREALRLAAESEDVLGLCYGLAQILVPLAFWMGDLDLAEARAVQLVELSRSQALAFWTTSGLAFLAAAARVRGGAPDGDFLTRTPSLSRLLVHTLGTILDDFADEPEDSTTHWASAEMARRRGERAIARGDVGEGRERLARALALAREQGARAWELRAATSLVKASPGDESARVALRALLETFDPDESSADVLYARRVVTGSGA